VVVLLLVTAVLLLVVLLAAPRPPHPARPGNRPAPTAGPHRSVAEGGGWQRSPNPAAGPRPKP